MRHFPREGYAQLSIVVNSPPYGGRVAASPTAGTAALDAFVLEALNWTDDADDLPLTFSFSYFNGEVRVKSQFDTMLSHKNVIRSSSTPRRGALIRQILTTYVFENGGKTSSVTATK